MRTKLALARSAGIKTKKVRGDASDLRKVKESYGWLVEATGSPGGFALAQHMTEARGTLVLKSTFHGAAPIETWPIVVKELTVVGSRCGPFAKAIALLHSGRVDPRPLITRTFLLSRSIRGDPLRPEIRCNESIVKSLRAWPFVQMVLRTVDTGRYASRAKTVVDIYDGHIRCARIEHAK